MIILPAQVPLEFLAMRKSR